MKTISEIYAAVHAAAVKSGATAQLLADIDTAFHGPDEPAAAPAPTASSDGGTTGYDSSKYAQRGADTLNAWEAAGSPQYDVAGREMDNAGWPTGKMKDGSSTGTGNAGAANSDPFSSWIEVVLATVDSSAQIPIAVPTPGPWYLTMSEQPDQNWDVVLNGVDVASGSSGQDASQAVQMSGTGTLICTFNKGSVSDTVLQQRLAAGQGVSRMSYQFRPAP